MDKLIEQPDNNIVDYRIVRLTDGSVLVGSITIDKDFLRIQNPLQLKSVPRMTSYGVKDDTVLEQWIPFTDDKLFVIPKDKVQDISKAAKELAHYYEVVLDKIETSDAKIRPALSADDIDRILDIAEEMDSINRRRT